MPVLPLPVSKKLEKLRKFVSETISDLYEDRRPLLSAKMLGDLSPLQKDQLTEFEETIDVLEALYEDLSGATRERLKFNERLSRLESEVLARLTKVESWQADTDQSLERFVTAIDKIKPGAP